MLHLLPERIRSRIELVTEAACWLVEQHLDGFQVRLGALKRGSYTVQVLFPANLHDQESPARALRRCPQVPGPTRSDTVTFEVE